MNSSVCTTMLSNVLHDIFSGSCGLDMFGISKRTRFIVMGTNYVPVTQGAFGLILIVKAIWAAGWGFGISALITSDGIYHIG